MNKLIILFTLLLTACSVHLPPPTLDPSLPQALACLQVGFGDWVDPNLQKQIVEKGWRIARFDLQRDDVNEANATIQMAQDAGFQGIYIIRDANQLDELPEGLMYELRNEPDLEGPSPADYRDLMRNAARVAKQRDQILFVGAVSNLNDRGFKYLEQILPIPDGAYVSVHRYGDGTFQNPHRGFRNRQEEVDYLKSLIGDTPFAVTEFGYPTSDLTEEQQYTRIMQELQFWHQQAQFACVYQINDGPGDHEKYGIRRIDGSWKPSADVVKKD